MIDAALIAALASVESSGNRAAIRFEPATYASQRWNGPAWLAIVSEAARVNKCSPDTAKMICSTSWGKFQIMGFNLYAHPIDYRGSIAKFANDADDQAFTLERFLNSKNINFAARDMLADRAKLLRFAEMYNGSGNIQAYAAKIEAALKRNT